MWTAASPRSPSDRCKRRKRKARAIARAFSFEEADRPSCPALRAGIQGRGPPFLRGNRDCVRAPGIARSRPSLSTRTDSGGRPRRAASGLCPPLCLDGFFVAESAPASVGDRRGTTSCPQPRDHIPHAAMLHCKINLLRHAGAWRFLPPHWRQSHCRLAAQKA
jgi:hypothetical protein